MHYAIVLYLDEEKMAWLTEVNQALVKETGSNYMENIPPHITIAGIVGEDEETIQNEFKTLSSKLKKGKFHPFGAEISKVALVKWEAENPYQELAVYELEE